jgi:hypothetical protein
MPRSAVEHAVEKMNGVTFFSGSEQWYRRLVRREADFELFSPHS